MYFNSITAGSATSAKGMKCEATSTASGASAVVSNTLATTAVGKLTGQTIQQISQFNQWMLRNRTGSFCSKRPTLPFAGNNNTTLTNKLSYFDNTWWLYCRSKDRYRIIFFLFWI